MRMLPQTMRRANGASFRWLRLGHDSPQPLQRDLQEFVVGLHRTDRIDRIEKAGGARNKMEPSRVEMRFHQPLTEIAATTAFQDVIQAEEAEAAHDNSRISDLGEGHGGHCQSKLA